MNPIQFGTLYRMPDKLKHINGRQYKAAVALAHTEDDKHGREPQEAGELYRQTTGLRGSRFIVTGKTAEKVDAVFTEHLKAEGIDVYNQPIPIDIAERVYPDAFNEAIKDEEAVQLLYTSELQRLDRISDWTDRLKSAITMPWFPKK